MNYHYIVRVTTWTTIFFLFSLFFLCGHFGNTSSFFLSFCRDIINSDALYYASGEMPYLPTSFLPTVWSCVERSRIFCSSWVKNGICWLHTVSWTKSTWSGMGCDIIAPCDVVVISPKWVTMHWSMYFFHFYLLSFCFFQLLTICFPFDSRECVWLVTPMFFQFLFSKYESNNILVVKFRSSAQKGQPLVFHPFLSILLLKIWETNLRTKFSTLSSFF